MANGYVERALRMEEGINTEYMDEVMARRKTLDMEQSALVALICKKCTNSPTAQQMDQFVALVEQAQALMPGGTIRSRQALVILAMQVGMS